MRLADFILDQLEPILQEWEVFARTMQPAAITMNTKDLRDHAALMLQTIAADLCTKQSSVEQTAKSHGLAPPGAQSNAGEDHGIDRLESQFTIEQLVSEYRALRASVLRRWSETNHSPSSTDLVDMTRFNEAIDQLLTSSVVSFAKATRDEVEAEKQRKDQFLAMLAHELRNPLSPISAAATLLKMAKSDQAIINNASNIIARQVSHMASLVDDMLDVSRVTRGQIEVNLQPVELRQVVEDAVEQVTPHMTKRHHQLVVDNLAEPAIVQGDKKRLVQVITNLLTNAAKYTPENGRIRLGVTSVDGHVVVVVEDNGIGLAADFVPHVFTLFAQAERTSDRTSGGLGLGLALVKSLVELHGGKVSCSSPGLGKGSRFTVSLPRQLDNDSRIDRRRSPRFNASGDKPLKIMVVDDNVDAAESLGLLLKAAGHQVFTEHEARHALAVAQTELPDVCLLDIGLPGMDGNELARHLRAHPETKGALVIALTGYCQPQERENSIKMGFDHYMTKPVDFGKLQSLLAALPS